jgi:hypothetical protein
LKPDFPLLANLIDAEMLAFLRDVIRHWNENDLHAMSAHFRDDAALSSPFVLESSTSTWVQGRQAIVAHLKYVRSRYRIFEIMNVATDTAFYTLLLWDGQQYLTVIVEPEPSPLLIRRMIICKSIFHRR